MTGELDLNVSLASTLGPWTSFWNNAQGFWSLAVNNGSVASAEILKTFDKILTPTKAKATETKTDPEKTTFNFNHLGLRGKIRGMVWQFKQSNLNAAPWIMRGKGNFDWRKKHLNATLQLANERLKKSKNFNISGLWNQLDSV